MLEYVRNGHGRPSYYINSQKVVKLTALRVSFFGIDKRNKI